MSTKEQLHDLRRRSQWVKRKETGPPLPYEASKYENPFPDLLSKLKDENLDAYGKIKTEKSWEGHENLVFTRKQSIRDVGKLNGCFKNSKIGGGNKSRRKVRKLNILTQEDHGKPFFPGGAPNYSPKSPKGHVFDTNGRPPVSPRTIKDMTMPWCRGNIY